MPYVCPQCGERDRFYADDASRFRSYRQCGSVLIDGRDGRWHFFETDGSVHDDTHHMEFANVLCSNCRAHAEHCDTETDVEAVLREHEHPIPPRNLEEHRFTEGRQTTLNY